ncbi:hypothetical protein [Phytobacter diazotrophicus]|uniref:hypothetical protein n=1 Tax=Phytobacter diazotrophicus TaxID=395631 RepID=UPI002FF0F1DE
MKITTTTFLLAGCFAAGCMLHYYLYRLMLADDVNVGGQRIADEKMDNRADIAGLFYSGIGNVCRHHQQP